MKSAPNSEKKECVVLRSSDKATKANDVYKQSDCNSVDSFDEMINQVEIENVFKDRLIIDSGNCSGLSEETLNDSSDFDENLCKTTQPEESFINNSINVTLEDKTSQSTISQYSIMNSSSENKTNYELIDKNIINENSKYY